MIIIVIVWKLKDIKVLKWLQYMKKIKLFNNLKKLSLASYIMDIDQSILILVMEIHKSIQDWE
jgi:hypothetical protein